MRKTLMPVSFAIAFLLSSALLSARPQTQNTTEDRERLLATGKRIFVERCAKCHDERGDKALSSGPPLSDRGLSDDAIFRAASGRLKNAPDNDKRAVALYISSFMKKK
jgi:mono/diheme cytochrome c family protein